MGGLARRLLLSLATVEVQIKGKKSEARRLVDVAPFETWGQKKGI
jgi:hypothetical protein